MTPIMSETFFRKLELAFQHPAGIVVAIFICLYGYTRWQPLIESVYGTMTRFDRVFVRFYAVMLGLIISLMMGLTHSMFRWGPSERALFELVAAALLAPAYIPMLRAVIQRKLSWIETAKSLPFMFLAMYLLFAFVYAMSPLTAIE